ncbi:MAG TPA: hypothetical protein VFC07_03695 [Verrucomicrobiae bacterium]|nr:hypothetical protein [Verrucomicrobiae bacterium]
MQGIPTRVLFVNFINYTRCCSRVIERSTLRLGLRILLVLFLGLALESNLFGVGYTVEGTLTYEATPVPMDQVGEISLPPGSEAHRAEILAALTNPVTKRSTFVLRYSDCKWKIDVHPIADPSFDVYTDDYDGTNILYFFTLLPPKDTNQTGAVLEPGPVPREYSAGFANCVWLAYASECYFEQIKDGLAVSPQVLTSKSGHERRFKMPVEFIKSSLPPFLPQAVNYIRTNSPYVLPSGELDGINLAPPFENGYTNYTFRASGLTNMQGLAFPRSFVFESIAPARGAKLPSDLRLVWRLVGAATNIIVEEPKITHPQQDRRLVV